MAARNTVIFEDTDYKVLDPGAEIAARICNRAKAGKGTGAKDETMNRLKGFWADLKRLKIANERSLEEETNTTDTRQLQAMQEWVQREKQSWKNEIGSLREELARERAERKLADATHSLALELAIGHKVNFSVSYFITRLNMPRTRLC